MISESVKKKMPKTHTDGVTETCEQCFNSGYALTSVMIDELKLTIAVLKAEATISSQANDALRSINKGISEATLNLHKELEMFRSENARLKEKLKIAVKSLEKYKIQANMMAEHEGIPHYISIAHEALEQIKDEK